MKFFLSISTMLLCMQLHAWPNGNSANDGEGQASGSERQSESHGEDVRAVAGALGASLSRAHQDEYHLELPAPLERMALGPPLVTDPRPEHAEDNPDAWRGAAEWTQLAVQIEQAHQMGVTTISVDAWWGLAMKDDGTYDFSYIQKVFDIIRKPHPVTGKKLKIAPILSAHRYGRNVNDHGATISLPKPILQKMRARGWGYKSELGNENLEAISPWAIKEALPDICGFWEAFRDNFREYAGDFSKIVIGMGPAGELVLPAYHSHDRANPRENSTSEADFPGRGVLQHRSALAIASLQTWLKKRYASIAALKAQWKKDYPLQKTAPWAEIEKIQSFDQLDILANPEQVDEFFANFGQYSQMGQDFFDWLHESLILDQGLTLGLAATDVFAKKDAGFENVRLALKVGGVHWQFHDRIPLLTAGLISTRGATRIEGASPKSWQPAAWSLAEGAGMKRIFTELLKPLRDYALKKGTGAWVGIFTCAEMESCKPDCLDTESHCFGRCGDCPHAKHIAGQARSGAEELTEAVMIQAGELGVPIFVENALEGNIHNEEALRRIERLLEKYPHIFGVSLLRLATALQSDPARRFYERQQARTDRRLPPRPVDLLTNSASDGLSSPLPILSLEEAGQLPCSASLLLVETAQALEKEHN